MDLGLFHDVLGLKSNESGKQHASCIQNPSSLDDSSLSGD